MNQNEKTNEEVSLDLEEGSEIDEDKGTEDVSDADDDPLPEGEPELETQEDSLFEDEAKTGSAKSTVEPVKRRPRKKGLASNRNKILIVVVIIVVAMVIGLWGAEPESYLSLEEVMENSGKYIGEEIKVVGKVGNWTGGQDFTLVGRENETVQVNVTHDLSIPDGFAIGKDVVVTGKLEGQNGNFEFISTSAIQVGCPSKY